MIIRVNVNKLNCKSTAKLNILHNMFAFSQAIKSTNLSGKLEVLYQVLLSSRQLEDGLCNWQLKYDVTLNRWYILCQMKPQEPETVKNRDSLVWLN